MITLFSILRPRHISDLKPLIFYAIKLSFPMIRKLGKNWRATSYSAPFLALENVELLNFNNLLWNFELCHATQILLDIVEGLSKTIGGALLASYANARLIEYYREEFEIGNTPQYKASVFEIASKCGLLNSERYQDFRSHTTWDLPHIVSGVTYSISLLTNVMHAWTSVALIKDAVFETKGLGVFNTNHLVMGLIGVGAFSTLTGVAISRYCKVLCASADQNKQKGIEAANQIQNNLDTLKSTGKLPEKEDVVEKSMGQSIVDQINHDVLDYAADSIQSQLSSGIYLLSFYFIKEAILASTVGMERGEISMLINKIFDESNRIVDIGQSVRKAFNALSYAKDSWKKLDAFILSAEESKVKVAQNQCQISEIEVESDVALSFNGVSLTWEERKEEGDQIVVTNNHTTIEDREECKFGEIVCIEAPSGSGKSSLVSLMMNGYSHAEAAGEVKVARNRVHLITSPDHGNSTIEEILKGVDRSVIATYAETLGIQGILANASKKTWATTSTGEKKRIALLHALSHNILEKSVVFLDEPFSGLDDKIKNSVKELLKQQVQEKNLCLVIIEHHDRHVDEGEIKALSIAHVKRMTGRRCEDASERLNCLKEQVEDFLRGRNMLSNPIAIDDMKYIVDNETGVEGVIKAMISGLKDVYYHDTVKVNKTIAISQKNKPVIDHHEQKRYWQSFLDMFSSPEKECCGGHGH